MDAKVEFAAMQALHADAALHAENSVPIRAAAEFQISGRRQDNNDGASIAPLNP